MLKYIFKSMLRLAVAAAVIFGIALAFGAEYKILAGANGGENFISYEKTSECEGRLSLGERTYNIDLGIVAGARDKLDEYIGCAASYIPDFIIDAGKYIYRTVADMLSG